MEGRAGQGEARERTVGDFVAEDYRTAEVFEKYGIDFCCGGKVTLSNACEKKAVDREALLRDIDAAVREPVERGQDFSSWPTALLADYIVQVHHGYLHANLDTIAAYARKIAEVHGARHPEVLEIARTFDGIASDMKAHLREEEAVFFPAVKRLAEARRTGEEREAGDAEALKASLASLRSEHEAIGEAVHAIRRLSGDYAIPDDACNTFVVTYRKLKEFEDDLHRHVHLENNILFPKAARL
jgi:regulator of cell morphogenesis and NO signaling